MARRRPVVKSDMPLRGDGVGGVRTVGFQKRQWWCICKSVARLRGVMQTAMVVVVMEMMDSGEETAGPRPTEQQTATGNGSGLHGWEEGDLHVFQGVSQSASSKLGLCRRRQQASRHVERRTDGRALAL
jgi:hypothetical protein